MKNKKVLCVFFSLIFAFSIICGTVVNAETENVESTESGEEIEWYIPQTLKVGDWIQEVSTNPGGKNGWSSDWRIGRISGVDELDGKYVYSSGLEEYALHTSAGGGSDGNITNGCAYINSYADRMYKPGQFLVSVYYEEPNSYDPSNRQYFEESLLVTVEEPIIKTNAPNEVKVGDEFCLTTELTNTSLKNEKISVYLDPDNWSGEVGNGQYFGPNYPSDEDGHFATNFIAYQPRIEIVNGEDIVERSDGDYTNTLSSTETLKFTDTGVVELKIIYEQFNSYRKYPVTEKTVYINVIDNASILGDVNMDGTLNILDATIVQLYLNNVDVTGNFQETIADINKDGTISIEDVTTIQKTIIKLI